MAGPYGLSPIAQGTARWYPVAPAALGRVADNYGQVDGPYARYAPDTPYGLSYKAEGRASGQDDNDQNGGSGGGGSPPPPGGGSMNGYGGGSDPLSEQIRQLLAQYIARGAGAPQIQGYGAYGVTPQQLGLFGGQQQSQVPDYFAQLAAGMGQPGQPQNYSLPGNPNAAGGGYPAHPNGAPPIGGQGYDPGGNFGGRPMYNGMGGGTPAGIPELGTGGNTPWTAAAYGGAAPTPGTAGNVYGSVVGGWNPDGSPSYGRGAESQYWRGYYPGDHVPGVGILNNGGVIGTKEEAILNGYYTAPDNGQNDQTTYGADNSANAESFDNSRDGGYG